jgi:predicted PurR-regulated permease PerM
MPAHPSGADAGAMTGSAQSREATESSEGREDRWALQPGSGEHGWGSARIAGATAVVTLTVLAIAGALAFFFEIRTILLWLLVGLILAVALEPGVAWLQRHKWNRVLASLCVSIATIALLVGAVLAVAYPLIFQSGQFISALPQLLDDLFGAGGSLHFLEARFHILDSVSSIKSEQVANVVLGGRAQVMSLLSRAASSVGAIVTIFTMMVMLLIEGPRVWKVFLTGLIGEERPWAEYMGVNFLRSTGGYVRGNVAISVVAGTAAYIALRILDVPYAETLAVFVAVFDIIPLVGATIAAVVVCIIALATGGLTDCIVLAVFFIVYQQFENNVLQNLVYSKTLALSPLIIFVAALIGATLAGLVGVLLAIPLASAAWGLAGDLVALHRARDERRGGRRPLVSQPPPDADPAVQPHAEA